MADVRALEREELAAMEAPAVVVDGRDRGVDLVARHRFRELERFKALVHRLSPEAQWGTAPRPGLSGVILGTSAASLLIRPDFFGPTRACSKTSLKVSTGTIWIFPWYLSSRRTSFMFDRGMTTFSIPSSAAASIFAVTPPTGRTCPRTLREPVIATAWFTGTSSRALMTAVATEIEALSPSVPSRDPTNWTWMSWFEMSSAAGPSLGLPEDFQDRGAVEVRDLPIFRDLLRDEPDQLEAVVLRVQHRGLHVDLVSVSADAGPQRRVHPLDRVQVSRGDEDEVAWDRLRLDHRAGRPLALADDREFLLLHRGQQALLALHAEDVDLVH